MVQRYKLDKKKKSAKQQENYVAVLPRIITSPRSREAAEHYINNADFQEKMAITRMLNEWNKETFSLEDTEKVIRPEAVPVIKTWLNTADESDVTCAKNLLSHISQEKKKADEITERNSPRQGTSQSSRPGSQSMTYSNAKRAHWKPSSRPGTNQSVRSSRPASQQSRKSVSSNGRKENQPQRPTMRPKTSITYGSYYPSSVDGFGNNTSHFNVVRSLNPPKTMYSKAQLYRQKYGDMPEPKDMPEPFNPVNRSSLFGNVVYPVPQESVNLDGGTSQRLLINSRQGRGSVNGSRPPTQGSRPASQGMHKRQSDDRLKYSANLQNDHEDVPQINTSPSPVQNQVVEIYGGDDTHRQLGLRSHWPGRHYQSTQYLLG